MMYRLLGIFAVCVVCLAASAAATSGLPSEAVVYDSEPFALWAYVALASTVFIPGAWMGGGGGIANLVASVVWGEGVPNYIWVGTRIFNLADVAILVGLAVLGVGTTRHLRRKRR